MRLRYNEIVLGGLVLLGMVSCNSDDPNGPTNDDKTAESLKGVWFQTEEYSEELDTTIFVEDGLVRWIFNDNDELVWGFSVPEYDSNGNVVGIDTTIYVSGTWELKDSSTVIAKRILSTTQDHLIEELSATQLVTSTNIDTLGYERRVFMKQE